MKWDAGNLKVGPFGEMIVCLEGLSVAATNKFC